VEAIMRHLSLLASLVLGVGLLGCGGKVGGGPCEGDNPDPICTQACDDASNPCPPGFYCAADGTCNADCTGGISGSGCGAGEYCDDDGHCQQSIDADCPDVTLTGERTTPTVQLLLDQSGSMTEGFGNTDRWNAMVDALIDGTNGVVTTTQSAVIFGASLYTYDETADATCPRVTSVPRALDNLAAISTLLNDHDPDADTPTGASIQVTVDDFLANPPPAGSPPIIILATDGEPDTCADPDDSVNGRLESIAGASRAFDNGIRLYILSVGDDVGADHLQDMANAGVGNDPAQSGTQAPFFVADNPAELAQQLQQLVGSTLSCELALDGTVDAAAANSGHVVLNGTELTPGVDWELVNGTTIRLLGDACDTLLASSNPTLSATFPCGVVVD
jgi:hypothetical protein